MTKRVVISGYYGFGNFGDEAILAVLTDKLKKLGLEVVVLSSNPRRTSMGYFVNSINSFDFHQVSGLIKQSDILISGGGSLLQDATSIKSLIYYLWVIFTALRFKKKVIIFAQGIGPIRNKIAQFVTSKILKRYDYVSVRDYRSQAVLEWWGVKSDLLCDPIFSLNLPINRNRGVLGVQLRDFATLNDNLLNKLARQIVKEFYDQKIEIFSFQDELDLAVCEKFQKILNRMNPNIRTEVIHGLSIQDMIARISELEYMIAMRFHALVVALKMGIRSLGINYDTKVEKLSHEAGIPLVSMDASEDFDILFNELKLLNETTLKDYADSKIFNWSNLEKILTD